MDTDRPSAPATSSPLPASSESTTPELPPAHADAERASIASNRWVDLHLWQMQPVRDLLLLAVIVGVIYVGYLIRIVTVPLLLAMALAYLFEPLIWRMMRLGAGGINGAKARRGWFSRQGAVLTILITVLIVFVVPMTLGTGFAAVQAAKSISDVTESVQSVQASIAKPEDEELRTHIPVGAWRSIRDFVVKAENERKTGKSDIHAAIDDSEGMSDLRGATKLVLSWLQAHGAEVGTALSKNIVGGGAQAVAAALAMVVSVGYLLFTIVLTGFFFFFISTSWGSVLAFWQSLIPDRRRGRVIELVRRMDGVIAGFVRGRLTICLIMGVYMTLAYWIIGVPAPLLVGPFVGMLFLLPMVHAIGVPIAAALLWFNAVKGPIFASDLAGGNGGSGWWWMLFAPVGVYLLAQILDDYILTPTIQGKTTALAIPTILFASLAGGALGGIYGLLIAIPTAACLRILLQEVFWPRFRAWAQGEAQDFLPISRE